MPDPTKRTVSATQVPALFGVSPYATPYTLYHDFKGDTPNATAGDETDRMEWGRRMQPLLLQKAAEDLKLFVEPFEEYVAKDGIGLGCTKDGIIICPDRGPGAIETKCVFDYRQWMQRWGGGEPPRDIELQLQTQMFVGGPKPDDPPYNWGVIAVFVCGEMKYFERKPIPDLWRRMENEAVAFLGMVENELEPDAFGEVVEDPYVTELWPTTDITKVLEIEDTELAETARMYNYATEQRASWEKVAKQLKPKIVERAEDAGILKLPETTVFIDKASVPESVRTYKAHTRTTVKVSKQEDANVE